MAVIETVRPAPIGAVAIHRIVVALEDVVGALRVWNQRRRTVAALRQLSPSQLRDIGLDGVDLVEFANGVRTR